MTASLSPVITLGGELDRANGQFIQKNPSATAVLRSDLNVQMANSTSVPAALVNPMYAESHTGLKTVHTLMGPPANNRWLVPLSNHRAAWSRLPGVS
ncbi:MAG: hypothetical protein ACRDC4_06150, partial [Plesiomonas sp.]